MLTKTALGFLSFTYRVACSTNSVPYQWDPVRLKLTHTESRLRLTMFYISIWAEWLYTAFKTARLFYAINHSSFFTVIIHAGWLSRDVLLSAFHLTSVRRRKEVPEFFNKLLHYDQHILPEYAHKQKVDYVPVGTDWCKLYHLGISFPVSVTFPLFLALFGWVLAPHPQFMASLFTNGDGVTHPDTRIKVCFLIMELWINYTCFFSCYFYTSTLFCTIQSMRFSLRLLSVPPQKGVEYGESIKRSKKLYRTLQVLNNYLNDCWRNILAPIQQAVDLILGSTYTCGFIKFHHTMGFVTLFCFVYQVLAVAGCTSSTYSIAGRLPRWTGRVFRTWKLLKFIDGDEFEEYDGELKGDTPSFVIEKETTRPPSVTKVREALGAIALKAPSAATGAAPDNLSLALGMATLSVNRLAVHKLGTTRKSVQQRHLKKFMKSCKPLYMKTGNFFTVTRKYGLGWFSWYVENTVSLTLAFNNN